MLSVYSVYMCEYAVGMVGKGREGDTVSRQHCKGCNCKRSGCLKNYCECYEVAYTRVMLIIRQCMWSVNVNR